MTMGETGYAGSFTAAGFTYPLPRYQVGDQVRGKPFVGAENQKGYVVDITYDEDTESWLYGIGADGPDKTWSCHEPDLKPVEFGDAQTIAGCCENRPFLRLAATELTIAVELLGIVDQQMNHSRTLFEQSIQIGELEQRGMIRELTADYEQIAAALRELRAAFAQQSISHPVMQGMQHQGTETEERPDWFRVGPGQQYPRPYDIGDQVRLRLECNEATPSSADQGQGIVTAIEWDDDQEDWQYGIQHDDESNTGFIAWGHQLEYVGMR